MKVMGDGLPGGTSFMEDYTYHLAPDGHQVLGAHMLEICESIAAGKPSLEIHPLGIGGKEDPVRLVFDAPAGPALNASLIDLGNRFRLLVNEVDGGRATSRCRSCRSRARCGNAGPTSRRPAPPGFCAGGAHHTGFSYSVTTEMLEDFATIAGIELVAIGDGDHAFRLQAGPAHNDVYYHLAQGFRA